VRRWQDHASSNGVTRGSPAARRDADPGDASLRAPRARRAAALPRRRSPPPPQQHQRAQPAPPSRRPEELALPRERRWRLRQRHLRLAARQRPPPRHQAPQLYPRSAVPDQNLASRPPARARPRQLEANSQVGRNSAEASRQRLPTHRAFAAELISPRPLSLRRADEAAPYWVLSVVRSGKTERIRLGTSKADGHDVVELELRVTPCRRHQAMTLGWRRRSPRPSLSPRPAPRARAPTVLCAPPCRRVKVPLASRVRRRSSWARKRSSSCCCRAYPSKRPLRTSPGKR
jgi:hypothetical protein